MHPLVRIAKLTCIIAALGWMVANQLMRALPPANQIDPRIYAAPQQDLLPKQEYTIPYKGQNITVHNMANYTLYGLIVSHNDPSLWYSFDISHDDKSINTRDICVLWGDNLKIDYAKMHFWSDDSTCEFEEATKNATFQEDQYSNNHLITDSDDIRQRISHLHTGDQVMVRGKLVNYSEERWNGKQRYTSMGRGDSGENASEIIFVEDLQIIKSFNAQAIFMRQVLFWISLGSGLFWIVVLFWLAEAKDANPA